MKKMVILIQKKNYKTSLDYVYVSKIIRVNFNYFIISVSVLNFPYLMENLHSF